MKEELFPGREHELGTAVDALQYLVLEFHKTPFNPDAPRVPEAQHVHVPVANVTFDTAEVKDPLFDPGPEPWAMKPNRLRDCGPLTALKKTADGNSVEL